MERLSAAEPPALEASGGSQASARELVREQVQVPCISSESLLGGATEVHIQHRGSLYRLKQTALGKLILTK